MKKAFDTIGHQLLTKNLYFAQQLIAFNKIQYHLCMCQSLAQGYQLIG